jgi:hypothetical protein
MRKVSQRGEILPQFVAAFTRLATYLDANPTITADEYFTLLCNRFSNTSRIPLNTKALGSDYYNNIVAEQRGRRREMFDGREATDTKTYLAVPALRSRMAPDALMRDVARFAAYRGTYHWFPWGRFWLFFLPEFSGAFLFVTDEYQRAFDDPLLHLTVEQHADWRALAADERMALKVRDCVTSFRMSVGNLCTRSDKAATLTYEQLVSTLSRVGRPLPRSRQTSSM